MNNTESFITSNHALPLFSKLKVNIHPQCKRRQYQEEALFLLTISCNPVQNYISCTRQRTQTSLYKKKLDSCFESFKFVPTATAGQKANSSSNSSYSICHHSSTNPYDIEILFNILKSYNVSDLCHFK